MSAALSLLVLLISAAAELPLQQTNGVLRVAADPNNLPFTNEQLAGFENKIAELIASDLNLKLEYQWRAQRRGFFRETLKTGDCDLVLGVPTGYERALTTKPYYSSSYVLVSRTDRRYRIKSLDDPELRTLRIGAQLIGADGVNTPPVQALAERGMVTNLVGFTVYGDYRQSNPAARIVEAVARDKVDIAIVWGPVAGYFAPRQPVPLTILPLPPGSELNQPFTFSIAMAVRKTDKPLRDALNDTLARRAMVIAKILREYGVPMVEGGTNTQAGL